MQILKRSGEKREFDTSKIETAIQKAFLSVGRYHRGESKNTVSERAYRYSGRNSGFGRNCVD